MDLAPGTPVQEISLDRVFIGSCTNSRISDLRVAAEVVRGRRVADHVSAMVVPGSVQVKAQAEAEGLDEVFRAAGFDWRGAGCSMCLGMNPDILSPGERCASTSNRNFEGRQGRGRTHASRLPADGRRGRHRGPLRRHPQLELGATPWRPSQPSPARSASSTGRTSTPTRSSPSSSSSAWSARALASSCSSTGRRSPAGTCRATRSSSRARTSGAAPRASTRRGRSRTTASTPSSRRASATSSTRTRRRSGCSRWCSTRPTCMRSPGPERPRSTSRRRRCASTGAAHRSRSTPTSSIACATDSTTSRSRCTWTRPSVSTSTSASESGPVTTALARTAMSPRIVTLPGDGIGPEIMAPAVELLAAPARR